MVYYIIHKCYNNYTFGALFTRFALKILLKTFVHVQFCSKFKFKHFYPLLFECHTYAVNPVIVDLRCVLVKTGLSRLSQMLWRKVVYSVVRRIVRYLLWINQHRSESFSRAFAVVDVCKRNWGQGSISWRKVLK